MKTYFFIPKKNLKIGLTLHNSNHVICAKNKKQAKEFFADTFLLNPKKYVCEIAGEKK